MITGDKLETAENVGVSCRLLHDGADRFFFTSEDEKLAKNIYKTMKRKIRENNKIKENEESDDSDELERDVVSEPPPVDEENKIPNHSYDTHRETK